MIIIRKWVLVAFILTLIITGYLGFASIELNHDKLIHFIMFMILTVEFYFVFDTQHKSIKMVRLLTFVVCTLGGSISSEIIQGIVNPKRTFDVNDILANVLGSSLGLVGCTVYEYYAIKQAKLNRIKSAQQNREVQFAPLPQIPEEPEDSLKNSVPLKDLQPV